ncbi:right-handed parallel beta-helix repeat-containing protein, partial [bacterium]|nr:right-handed parallel beta-helix repeat-containing protein [bacterium]
MLRSVLLRQQGCNLPLLFLVSLLMIVAPTTALPNVIHVPSDYETIEEALQNVSDFDTILVSTGVYAGISYQGNEESPEDITIMGSGWPNGTTIIKCEDNAWAFWLWEVVGWRITNFEITQCGGGFYLTSTVKCEIDHNHIHGLRYGYSGTDYWPTAISSWSIFGADVHHNLIVDSDHSGLCLQTWGHPGDMLTDVHIYNNTFDEMTYEGIMFKGPGEAPLGCIVTNNIIVNCGGQGVEFAYCDQNDTEVSYNCVFQTSGPWENVIPRPGNLYESPRFLQEPTIPEYYYLSELSPCIDAGNPDVFYNDPDSSRSDMGAFPCGELPNIVRLSIAWVDGYPGDTVHVPISISRVTGLNVTNCDFTISYPTEDLEFIRASIPEGSLPHQAGWSTYYQDLGSAFSYRMWAEECPLSGAGLLAVATFVLGEDVLPGTTWDLSFIEVFLNDGAIEVITTDGGIVFAVGDLLYGDFNLSGNVSLLDVSKLFDYLIGEVSFNTLQQLLAEVSAQGGITAYDGALITQYCYHQFDLFPVEGGGQEMGAAGRLSLPTASVNAGDVLEITMELDNGVNVSAAQFDMTLGGAPVELVDISIPNERVWFSRDRGVYPDYEVYLGGKEILNGHQDI